MRKMKTQGCCSIMFRHGPEQGARRVYFYLDKPENGLPPIESVERRSRIYIGKPTREGSRGNKRSWNPVRNVCLFGGGRFFSDIDEGQQATGTAIGPHYDYFFARMSFLKEFVEMLFGVRQIISRHRVNPSYP
jgi:hypothetical protein